MKNRKWFSKLVLAGGDDGTRTRDLMRDRQHGQVYLADFAAHLATEWTKKHIQNGEVVLIWYSLDTPRPDGTVPTNFAHSRVTAVKERGLHVTY